MPTQLKFPLNKKPPKRNEEEPFSTDDEIEVALNNALVLTAKWKRLEELGPNRGHALLSFSNGLLETLREILETAPGEETFCRDPELVLCLLTTAAIIMAQDISPDTDKSMKTFLRSMVRARSTLDKIHTKESKDDI